MNDAEAHAPVHEERHEIHKGDESALIEKAGGFYVRSSDPHEAPGLYQTFQGELFINLPVSECSHR